MTLRSMALGLALVSAFVPITLAHADDAEEATVEEPPVTLSAYLSVSMFRRRFEYQDDIYGLLRDYELSGAPALGFGVEAYPAARMDQGPLRHFGASLRYWQAVGIETTRSDGTTFPTRALGLDFDLRGRLPIMERSELGASIGYGRQLFEIESALAVPGLDNEPGVPSIDQRYLRLGFDTMLRPWRELRAQMKIAYLAVVSSGDIESEEWFPNALSDGFELDLALGWRFPHGIFADGAMEFRHYWFDMRSEPGDDNVAGGASDNYLAFTLRVGWEY